MGRKRLKYGRGVTVYLSNETIRMLTTLTSNKSNLIEALIIKEYKKVFSPVTTEVEKIINEETK